VQYFKFLQMLSTSEANDIFGENYSQRGAASTRKAIKDQVSSEQAKRQATIDANATIIRQNAGRNERKNERNGEANLE
jgi:hypothetical protein